MLPSLQLHLPQSVRRLSCLHGKGASACAHVPSGSVCVALQNSSLSCTYSSFSLFFMLWVWTLNGAVCFEKLWFWKCIVNLIFFYKKILFFLTFWGVSIPDGQSVTCDQHTGPQPLLPSLPLAPLLRLGCVWWRHPELKEPLGKDFVMSAHNLSFINLDSLKQKWGYVWNVLVFKFNNRVYRFPLVCWNSSTVWCLVCLFE